MMDSNTIDNSTIWDIVVCDATRSHLLKACGGNAFSLLSSDNHTTLPVHKHGIKKRQVDVVRLGFAKKRFYPAVN